MTHEDETRTENAAAAEFPAPVTTGSSAQSVLPLPPTTTATTDWQPLVLSGLPTTLSPGALARIGLREDDDLRADVQAQLAKVGPGHGRALLRFSLTDDILGASIAAAQRTTSGWEFTESAGVTYSRRDEKLTARVTLEVSY